MKFLRRTFAAFVIPNPKGVRYFTNGDVFLAYGGIVIMLKTCLGDKKFFHDVNRQRKGPNPENS